MKSLFPLLAIVGLGISAGAVMAGPLPHGQAGYRGRAEIALVQGQNDVDRAVNMVRRRMAGRGNFVSAERLDEASFRVTWKDGNRILNFRVNLRDNTVDED